MNRQPVLWRASMTRMNKGTLLIAALVAVAVFMVAWLLFAPKPEATTAVPAEDTSSAKARADSTASTSGSAVNAAPHSILMQQAPSGSATSTAEPLAEGVTPQRQRADKLRETLMALYSAEGGQPGKPKTMPLPEGDGNQATKPLGRYIQRLMEEQFAPLAGSCYEQLLERSPSVKGTVVLELAIMGDPAVGGVVADVSFGEGTTFKDEAFGTCVQESAYALTFDAPPEGRTAVTVTQSFEFEP